MEFYCGQYQGCSKGFFSVDILKLLIKDLSLNGATTV